jgi:superfamily I DNA/RNA helicase
VAITRVKDNLIIYVPGSDTLKGGIRKMSEPSRFIAEMRVSKENAS